MVPLELATIGAMPAPAVIQIFGTPNDRPTRAAQRFFKERRVAISFVDLRRKPMAPGELHRFVDRLGARALADMDGRAWREAALGYLSMDDAELADRLLADQRLLRLPLIRAGNALSVGPDEEAWTRMIAGSG
jgi:arsenate reductase-like glutaredoxin family protein